MNYYVYKIDDPITNQFYFGSRGSSVLSKNDTEYLGSMCTWKPENKSRLIKTIIQDGFNSMDDALEYEGEIISKNIDNPLNENYYIPKRGFHTHGMKYDKETRELIGSYHKGKVMSTESRNKMSESRTGEGNGMYGRKHTAESIQKMKNKRAIQVITEEHRRKIGDGNRGKFVSVESRKRISEALKGIQHEIISCPHCEKIGSKPNMVRWHFDNCKEK